MHADQSRKAVILILDYGTTALKAVAYNDTFHRLYVAVRDWHYLYPAPNSIEYPAEEYWKQTLSAVAELRTKVGGFAHLRAISVTGQSETMILLDANGDAVGNAIVWLDGRPVEECEAAQASFPKKRLYALTGNPDFNVNMPLLKMQWLKRHEPERVHRMDKLLLLKDYIIYKLSGRIVSEHTVNCCTGYFDINTRDWSDELLDLGGLTRGQLPEIASTLFCVGSICPDAAAATGIQSGVKVINGLLDQCASAIGAGNLMRGMICETTGTVLAVAATLDDFHPDTMKQPILMFCHAMEGKYLALPNCPTAGVLLTWFQKQFMADDEGGYCRIDREVGSRLHKDSMLIMLPHFSGRLSPVVNSRAKGVLYGLTLDCDKFDIARSIMESVAYLLRENLELLETIDVGNCDIVSLGGAAKSAVWQQMKADICERNIVTLEDDESTAFGCALNAGIAIGMLETDDIPEFVHRGAVCHPMPERSQYYHSRYQAYLDLNRQLGYNETLP